MQLYEPCLALLAGLGLAFAAPPACGALEPAQSAGQQAKAPEVSENAGPQPPELGEIAERKADEVQVEEVQAEEVQIDAAELLDAATLEALVAPVALYPDDLLAIVLPASTYPLQVVQAARFLEARNQGVEGEPDEGWNEAIVALLNYPEALQLLNGELDWTWRLGEAVQTQEQDVIKAVMTFREQAHLAGNLESDSKQKVALGEEGAIEIKPAVPDESYVPYYEPAEVVVRQTAPVYRYYPLPYPVYYYPYHSSHRFPHGRFWGVTSAFSLSWGTGRLHRHRYGFHDHPYFGYSYYDPFYYRRPSVFIIRDRDRDRRRRHERHHEGNRWQPDNRRQGARPNANPRRPGRPRTASQPVVADSLLPPLGTPALNRPSIRTGSGPNAPQPSAQTSNPARIGVRGHEPKTPKPGAISYRPAGVSPLHQDAVRRPFPTGGGSASGTNNGAAAARGKKPAANALRPARPAPPPTGALSARRTGRAAVRKAPAQIAPLGGLNTRPATGPKPPGARAPKAPVRTAVIQPPPTAPPGAVNRAALITGKAPPAGSLSKPSASMRQAVRAQRAARQPAPAQPRQTRAPRAAERPSMPSRVWSPPAQDAAQVKRRTRPIEQPARATAQQPPPRASSVGSGERRAHRDRATAQPPPRVSPRVQATRQAARARPNMDRPPSRRTKPTPPRAPRTKPR